MQTNINIFFCLKHNFHAVCTTHVTHGTSNSLFPPSSRQFWYPSLRLPQNICFHSKFLLIFALNDLHIHLNSPPLHLGFIFKMILTTTLATTLVQLKLQSSWNFAVGGMRYIQGQWNFPNLPCIHTISYVRKYLSIRLWVYFHFVSLYKYLIVSFSES